MCSYVLVLGGKLVSRGTCSLLKQKAGAGNSGTRFTLKLNRYCCPIIINGAQ